MPDHISSLLAALTASTADSVAKVLLYRSHPKYTEKSVSRFRVAEHYYSIFFLTYPMRRKEGPTANDHDPI